jgi:hypothetical protein
MKHSYDIGLPRRPRAVYQGLGLLLLLLGLVSSQAVQAQVSGVSYTIAPAAEHVFFNRNAGLEDGFLYGGEVGFGFGRFVELSGFYLFNDGLKTDFSDVSGLSETTLEALSMLPTRDVRFQRYGGNLKFNLLPGSVVPFVELGGGLVQGEPEGLNSSQAIFLSAGAGVQLTLGGRFALMLSAKNFSYRYNLGATFFSEEDLAEVGLSPESFAQTRVNNWALSAGLRAYLGGRQPGEETELDRALRQELEGGLSGLTLRGEGFGGAIEFSDDLAYRSSQRMAGVNLGLNFGPLVGLRGFYWRGVEDGSLAFDDLQAYGGEMQLNLSSRSRGLSPFLLLGGGYMDVLSGYEGREGARPEDEPFLTGGGGAVIPLGSSLRLKGSIRALLMSTEGVDNVNTPSEVKTSFMYSVGLNFVIGGGGRSAGDVVAEQIETSQQGLEAELALANARLDSMRAMVLLAQQGDTLAMQRLQQMAEEEEGAPQQAAAQRGRMVTLPLPEQGELYIRFGDPGGVSIESMFDETGSAPAQRSAAGTTFQTFTPVEGAADTTATQTFAAPPGQTLSTEQIQQIVRQTIREEMEGNPDSVQQRLEGRINELEQQLQQQSNTPGQGAVIVPPPQQQAPQQQQDATPEQVEQADLGEADVLDAEPTSGVAGVLPYVGVMVGDATQFSIGLRGDFRTEALGVIRLLPEVVFGTGDGTTSYHVSLNATVAPLSFGTLVPYAGLGIGLLSFGDDEEIEGNAGATEFTINVPIGTEMEFDFGRLFAEYMMIDWGDFNRFSAGYRFTF